MKKAVLAYSGGLDTSIMIPWLQENYGCDVVAVCVDLGQGRELEGLEEKALRTGAKKVYIEDLREEFVRDFIFPTLRAGAVYEDTYLLGTSCARPLIAKRIVEIAHREKATMVAHGATGKGNDQVRFELAFMALDPALEIVAPWRDPAWTLTSREECIAYARERDIPISQSKKRIYSEDRNVWHLSHEGGMLENPAVMPPDDVYTISATPEQAPDAAELVEIAFQSGTPVSIDGIRMRPLALLEALNARGAEHAIGQVDMVENRLVGIKSRGIYETPGGTILHAAHRELERLVLDRDTSHFKSLVARKYAELVYDGRWFSPLREALDSFVDATQRTVSGSVRLKLYKGTIRPAGTEAADSLYIEDLASFSESPLYDQKDATGFIRLFGLPLRVRGMVERANR